MEGLPDWLQNLTAEELVEATWHSGINVFHRFPKKAFNAFVAATIGLFLSCRLCVCCCFLKKMITKFQTCMTYRGGL